MRKLANDAGRGSEFKLDSAGTHDFHTGSPPDARAQQHALRRGYDLSDQRARQIRGSDFTDFDLILAMDRENLTILERVCPPEHKDKLRLFMSCARQPDEEVPDPYVGGEQGFEDVLDMVEDAARGLLRDLRPDSQSS